MTGQGQILSSNTSAVTSAASVATGITVLPNTGGNIFLTILGLTTLIIGGLVLTSFIATKVANRYYQK